MRLRSKRAAGEQAVGLVAARQAAEQEARRAVVRAAAEVARRRPVEEGSLQAVVPEAAADPDRRVRLLIPAEGAEAAIPAVTIRAIPTPEMQAGAAADFRRMAITEIFRAAVRRERSYPPFRSRLPPISRCFMS